MKATACLRKEYGALLLCLAAFVFIFVLRYMDNLEFQPKSTIIMVAHQSVSTHPHMNRSFCTFQPLSPEDALEEYLILDSTAWPETPLLPARPKKSGGDFLLARLHNRKLEAGVAGQVVDHLNGSYSAVFSLLWEGDAQVEVTLVHPGEAISVLNRLNREQPDRMYFKSLFRSGSLSETTLCSVCLKPTQQPLCNYTDLRTGEPWFCYKPKSLSCDARINHFRAGSKENFLNANEEKLFQR